MSQQGQIELLKIHPLVIASASDHFTRVQVNGGNISGSAAVIGLLFGSVHENTISVYDATDVLVDNHNNIAESEVDKKSKLWTAVYPTYQLIGWYSFDSAVNQQHYHIHQTLLKFFPFPVFILFQTNPQQTSSSSAESTHPQQQQQQQQQLSSLDRIPMATYLLESVETQQQSVFIEKNYTIESTEVEKLALDEITKSIPVKGSSKLEIHAKSLITSLTLLANKIGKIAEIVDKMENGTIERNPKLLQSARKICDSLTALQSAEFQNAFQDDFNDSLLAVYLSSVMKAYGNLSEVSELAGLVGENKGNKALL